MILYEFELLKICQKTCQNHVFILVRFWRGEKMLIGYARVSKTDQNLDRQIDALVSAGVDPRMIYMEKMTGTRRDRPELTKMLSELVDGDVVLIPDLTRISRSTRDLLYIVDQIQEKGAKIKSLKDTWLDTSSDNPYNDFLLTVMSGLSQLERDLNSQRTKEGLAAARARGRCGGRPSKQNEKKDVVLALYRDGMKISEIVKHTDLSRSTIYRILKIKNNT